MNERNNLGLDVERYSALRAAKPATRDIVEARHPTMNMGRAILDVAPLDQLAAVRYGTPRADFEAVTPRRGSSGRELTK